IYVLTFSNPPDNRITPSLITTFINVLDFVEKHVPRSAVLVTTSSNATPKFYSNGFMLTLGRETPEFHHDYWNKLLIRLLTLPIPTVALVSGHAVSQSHNENACKGDVSLQSRRPKFAAGFMLALHHDYRVMNFIIVNQIASKGWLCMNEIEFGGELTPSMTSILREKLDAKTYRAAVLEAHRFTGPEALSSEIVDALGDMSDVVKLIEDRKLIGKGSKEVFGLLRDEMYRVTVGLLERYPNKAGTQRDDKEKLGLPRWSKL
ncbi:hypothetical protein FRB95_006316, partial [Tulasnella sp. JGI-2019a]